LHRIKQQTLTTSQFVKSIEEMSFGITVRQAKLIESATSMITNINSNPTLNLRGKRLKLAVGKTLESAVGNSYVNNGALLSSLNKTLERASIFQSMLPKINLGRVANSFNLSIDTKKNILNSFSALLSSYSDLNQSLDQLIIEAPSVKIISERPALELLNSVDLLKSISVDDVEDKIEEEEKKLRNEILAEEENIEEVLAKKSLQELQQIASK
jgi:hypothetical protein